MNGKKLVFQFLIHSTKTFFFFFFAFDSLAIKKKITELFKQLITFKKLLIIDFI